MKASLFQNRIVFGLAFALLVATANAADAGHARYAVSAQANVSVWVEGGDVFSNYADVAVWLRPERDCYTTLFMVDTDGYMHVLYPNSAYDDTWLYGGRSYCYRACDFGLDRLDGVGIAYVFAVGSPMPFDYSVYGAGLFVGNCGFRVYGDPFVACRDFYMTLLPVSCRWDFVGVSYARFYVRHWARYPSYLCYGGPGVHVYVGDGCRACNDVFVSYRASCARPGDAFRPAPKFKQVYAGVARSDGADRGTARVSRVERVQRENFKGERGSSPREFTAKQVVKPTNRSYESIAKKRAIESQTRIAHAVRPTERIVSTSSARERASVDRADVAAMTKHATRAVRATRPSENSKSATVAQKSTRSETAREKGSKKKQAR